MPVVGQLFWGLFEMIGEQGEVARPAYPRVVQNANVAK